MVQEFLCIRRIFFSQNGVIHIWKKPTQCAFFCPHIRLSLNVVRDAGGDRVTFATLGSLPKDRMTKPQMAVKRLDLEPLS